MPDTAAITAIVSGAFRAAYGELNAFQQVSELLPVSGIELVGELSPEIQPVTVFSAGIPVSATQPEAARTLIGYLASPDAAATIKKIGMDPLGATLSFLPPLAGEG